MNKVKAKHKQNKSEVNINPLVPNAPFIYYAPPSARPPPWKQKTQGVEKRSITNKWVKEEINIKLE